MRPPAAARPTSWHLGRPGAFALVLAAIVAGCGGDAPDGRLGQIGTTSSASGNSGEENAPCVVGTPAASVTDTPPGTSTTGLGRQPAGYELRAPTGRPRGVVLVVHGGGWTSVGPGQLDIGNVEASRWIARGWATANIDYRPCATSFDDVMRFHDAIRSRIGPRTPLVVAAESAGAQLSFILAARRPGSVGAVIAKAPPTDPRTLQSGRALNQATGALDSPQPADLAATWRRVFSGNLRASTPVAQARRIQARVLMARSVSDPLIPQSQVDEMAKALRRAHPRGWLRSLDLPAGSVAFPHAAISEDSERRLVAAEEEAVSPWTARPPASFGVPVRVRGWWGSSR